jgi:hypothetical protein
MLPKSIYFYWGNETMSFLRYMTFKSFRFYHPNWKMTLIKRRDKLTNRRSPSWAQYQDFTKKFKSDYSNKLGDLDINIEWLEDSYPEIAGIKNITDVHTSDILAWYILANKGGIVSDTDIVYVKKIDYEKYKDVDFGMVSFEGQPMPTYMPVSFMLGQPNVIWDKIYKTSRVTVNKNVYESAGTPALRKATTGHITQIVKDYPTLNVRRLPSKIVFPFSEDFNGSKYKDLNFEKDKFDTFSEDTIGIHWYAGRNGVQMYNSRYNIDTYANYKSTVSRAIGACM